MTKEDFIKALNQDLANEYAAIIQYTTYAATVTGPYRPQLTQLFASEIQDELNHAQFLADKITTLGGTPTTVPSIVAQANNPKQMLEEIIKAEANAVQSYTQRANQASDLGYKALALDLEDMIRDETNHNEEISKIIEGW